MMKATALVLMVLAGLASASNASAQDRWLDEAYLSVWLHTRTMDASTAYNLHSRMRVWGEGVGRQDALRLTLKKGRRVLKEFRCTLQLEEQQGQSFLTNPDCKVEDEDLTATGELTLEIVFEDDENERRVPLRTLTFTVDEFYTVRNTTRGRNVYASNYQINGDALLGGASMWMRPAQFGVQFGEVLFYFWGFQARGAERPRDASLRCYHNDQRIRGDLARGQFLHPGPSMAYESSRDLSGQDTHFGWYRYELRTNITHNMNRNDSQSEQTQPHNMSDNPGNYRCSVRIAGDTVREFRWVVADDGTVALHPEQEGQNALHLRDNSDMRVVDVRLPTPSSWDRAVNPAAIRRRSYYGRRWQNAASVGEMMGALPRRAVGRSVPAAPRR